MGTLAVLTVPRAGIVMASGGTPIFVAIWLIFYLLIGIFFLIIKPKVTFFDFIIYLPAIYAMFSSAWSLNPTKSITYSTVFLINAISATLICRLFDIKALLRTLCIVITTLAALSIILGILNFELVKYFDYHERPTFLGTEPLRGLFNHKITAGLYSSIGIFLALFMFKGYTQKLIIFTCLIFNFLTGSATGIVLVFLGTILSIYYRYSGKMKVPPVTTILTLLIFIYLLLILFGVYGAEILTALGRDPTLTGRTILWQWGLDTSYLKPIHGWGYLGYNGTSLAEFDAGKYPGFQEYTVPHFHNSYIQTFVDFGYLISFLLIVSYAYSLFWWYKEYYNNRDTAALCMAVLISVFLLGGMSIYMFGRYNDFPSFFLMLTVSYIGKSSYLYNSATKS
jgi:exopolysaccharide production protein ExoQ